MYLRAVPFSGPVLCRPCGRNGPPDPGASFLADGELLSSGAALDGVRYDVYGYTYEKSASSSLQSTVTAYQWKVQAADFSWESLEDKSAYDGIQGDSWYAISRDGLTAQLCVCGDYFSTSCTATLYVPEGMPFALDEDTAARSHFQNDLYIDAGDLWTEDADSSNTRVSCLSCHGTGICGICGGNLTYKNPLYRRLARLHLLRGRQLRRLRRHWLLGRLTRRGIRLAPAFGKRGQSWSCILGRAGEP